MTDVAHRPPPASTPPPLDIEAEAGVVPEATGGPRRRISDVVVPPLVTLVFFVGLWYFVSYVLLKPSRRFLLPPPQQVIRVGFLDWRNFHQILDGLALTARAAAEGFVIATVLGMAWPS
jgi:NitT/TauT family transport system permease protein